MNLLNTIAELPEEKIRGYYTAIVETHYSNGKTTIPFDEDKFVKILRTTPKENIVYVIGYIRKTTLSENSQSSIAKYETVKLIEDTETFFKYNLKIIHIPKA